MLKCGCSACPSVVCVCLESIPARSEEWLRCLSTPELRNLKACYHLLDSFLGLPALKCRSRWRRSLPPGGLAWTKLKHDCHAFGKWPPKRIANRFGLQVLCCAPRRRSSNDSKMELVSVYAKLAGENTYMIKTMQPKGIMACCCCERRSGPQRLIRSFLQRVVLHCFF